MTIKYYLGIKVMRNHDCGASIVKYKQNLRKLIMYVFLKKD